MSIEEQVSRLLHELTPEPPRPVTAAQVTATDPRAARRQTRGGSRWLVVVGAAAALAVVAATPVVVRALANHGPATSVAAPTGSGSTVPSTISSPAPTRSPSTGGATTPALGPAVTGTLRAAGAVLPLPTGWVARSASDGWFGTTPVQTPPTTWPSWCLAPAGATGQSGCAILLRAVPTTSPPGAKFSVNADGGWAQDPTSMANPCRALPGGYTEKLTDYRDLRLGGRHASYRAWTYGCPGGQVVHVAQYVVPTAPAFVLYTDQADARTTAALSALAGAARLPAQTAPLPYTLTGMVTGAYPSGGPVKITVQPEVRLPSLDGWVPVPGASPQTFLVPAALVPPNGADYRNYGLVEIVTDGHTVTQLSLNGG